MACKQQDEGLLSTQLWARCWKKMHKRWFLASEFCLVLETKIKTKLGTRCKEFKGKNIIGWTRNMEEMYEDLSPTVNNGRNLDRQSWQRRGFWEGAIEAGRKESCLSGDPWKTGYSMLTGAPWYKNVLPAPFDLWGHSFSPQIFSC